MRIARVNRSTNETDISMSLNLDGCGDKQISTGCGFLDHMLELFAYHGRFDLSVTCSGDTYVDFHHTVEDIGIALGQAVSDALALRKGIVRYGSFLMPMDETLVMCALDISGRAYLNFDVSIPAAKIGDFDTELAEEFFTAFARTLGATLHFKQLAGHNSHHIIEACFKGFARSLAAATAVDASYEDEIPSSKGLI